MSFNHVFQLILFLIGLLVSIRWIIPTGYQVWFYPDEFEKGFKVRVARHWLSVGKPKYNWKANTGMYQMFTLAFALVVLFMAIEILLGLVGLVL